MFNREKIVFMGHTLSNKGIKIDEIKVEAIKTFKTPENAKQVLSFLGLVNFCAKFVSNFASVAESLRKLTRKKTDWQWTTREQRAFDKLKDALMTTKVLAYYDQNAETKIIVDASPFGVGAILTQNNSMENFNPSCTQVGH